ncbi:Alpha/Beta hydrolase protein [Xylariaceae sp. FL1272]|nr:Alpha/Beta hydrolase protein [Xylariaceae sp. FL1272]
MSPAIVLVPGAFGTPAGFDKLRPYLDGFQTFAGPYPSCESEDPMNATCIDDISSLRGILESLLEEGRDLVIVAHSYGGVVSGGATKGLDIVSRQAQGYNNGVIGVVYIAGNITLDGETLLEAVGGAYPPFIKCDKPSKGFALIEPAMDILYNDCEPSAELETSVKKHALNAFETKPSAPGWKDKGYDGRRMYIRTLEDRCNPVSLQNQWIEKSGVKWEVVDFDTGHMPFISQPQPLADRIVMFVREAAKL